MTNSEFVVVIPTYNNFHLAQICLDSVLAYTPSDVLIVISDDASPDGIAANSIDIPEEILHNVLFVRRDKNLGFVGNCNSIFEEFPDKHIILLNSDAEVGPGWFEAMIAPLAHSLRVGTVTAMTNNGGLAEVKFQNEMIPFLEKDKLKDLNLALSENTPEFFVEIPVGVGHCILVSRDSRHLCKEFSEEFAPGYGEEVDYSIRATQLGFSHYLANTFVNHAGGESFGAQRNSLQIKHDELLNKKYSGYFSLVQNWITNNELYNVNLLRVLNLYRGTDILIDARLMQERPTGTSRLIANLINSMAKLPNMRITVLVSDHLVEYWEKFYGGELPVTCFRKLHHSTSYPKKFDFVLVPNQISNHNDIDFFKTLSHRLIFQQLDFISFHNWRYFISPLEFFRYRKNTEYAYSNADGVIYISKYVQDEARDLGLPSNLEQTYIYCGVDHLVNSDHLGFHEREDLILIYGAKFWHKNFLYGIELLSGALEKNLNMRIIAIGPEPTFGNVTSDLQDFRESRENINIEIKNWISDSELSALIKKAKLVLYPTNSEGFGFVPFEAAKLGTPTLFAQNSSMKELFNKIPISLTYDRNLDLGSVDSLLFDENVWRKQLEFIRSEGEGLTWNKTAHSTSVFLSSVLRKPLRMSVQSRNEHGPNFDFSPKQLAVSLGGSLRFVLYLFPLYTRRRKFIKKVATKIFS